jgi:hypothetical protein
MKALLKLLGVLVIVLLVIVFLGDITSKKTSPVASEGYSYRATTTSYEIVADSASSGNPALDTAVKNFIEREVRQFATQYNPNALSEEDIRMLGFGEGRTYQLYATSTTSHYNNLSSTLVELYQFTGGAHGGTLLTSFTYDDAGNSLALANLFAPNTDYLTRVANAATPLLQKKLQDEDTFVLEMFDPGVQPTEENYKTFTVSDEGITVVFQQYQVGPYVIGSPEVTIPFDVLNDILNQTYFNTAN